MSTQGGNGKNILIIVLLLVIVIGGGVALVAGNPGLFQGSATKQFVKKVDSAPKGPAPTAPVAAPLPADPVLAGPPANMKPGSGLIMNRVDIRVPGKESGTCARVSWSGEIGAPPPSFTGEEQQKLAMFLTGQVYKKCSGAPTPSYWTGTKVEVGKRQCIKTPHFDNVTICWTIEPKSDAA